MLSHEVSGAIWVRAQRDERGGVAIVAGFLLPILIGGFALGAEAGLLYMKQRKLQHAADVAAFAGAVRLMQGETIDQVRPAARTVACGTLGFPKLEDPACQAIVDSPSTVDHPTSGVYAGDQQSIEVYLVEEQKRYLTHIFGDQAFKLEARSVARYRWDSNAGEQACLFSLSPDAQTAIKALGNSATNYSGCNIVANSEKQNAINVDNVTAECIYAVGDGNATNSTITCGGIQDLSRALRDPYADRVLPPMDAACTISGNQVYPKSLKQDTYKHSHPAGCNYTVFTGNVEFQRTVILAPGYYVFRRGFKTDPNSANKTWVDGTSGVTLIFNGPANNDFQSGANATWNITAPTSGPTAGLAVWVPEGSGIDSMNFTANGSSTYTGAIYAPGTDLTMNGGSSNTSLPGGGCTQLIANTLNITGSSTFSASNTGCFGTGTEPVRIGEEVGLVMG